MRKFVLVFGKIGFGAKLGFWYLIGLIFLALFIPFIGLDPNWFDPSAVGEPLSPSFMHLLGTDDFGRDLLLRIIFGARVSLAVGIISVGISVFIGVGIGMVSGFLGGMVDAVIMRLVDMFMAIPTIFLILTIQILLKPSIYNVMIVIGLTSWMGVARMVRAEVLSIKTRTFVIATRARGINSVKILFKHILPHTLNPIIVASMLGMGSAILTESVLSFLGLGVQPPHASWGNMLENSMGYMYDAPWMALAPGVFITITVLALNFLGDGLRLLLNPKEWK